jgi:hypothetical protein
MGTISEVLRAAEIDGKTIATLTSIRDPGQKNKI